MANGSFTVPTTNQYVVGWCYWESYPNYEGNYSLVQVSLFFSRTNSGYETKGSGTFSVQTNLGQSIVRSTSFSITQNSNTQVLTGSFTVAHNADGRLSFRMSAGASTNVFSNLANGMDCTMDAIPRASTLSSNIDWTLGLTDLPITINRASSNFEHIIRIGMTKPNGEKVFLAWRSGIGDSTNVQFTMDELTQFYIGMGQFEERPAHVIVQTWNNGNIIGETEKTGVVRGITPATMICPDFDIGATSVDTTTDYWYSNFQYDLTFTFGSFSKFFGDIKKFPKMTFTQDDINKMYSQIPNDNSGKATLKVVTKYNGVLVNDGIPKPDTTTITVYARNSAPTYNGGMTYADINTVTTNLTKNNQYIVQNNSKIRVTLPVANKAQANNGATMKSYDITINGVTKSVNYSDTATLTVDFDPINVSSNTVLRVEAVDSRGNRTAATSAILVVAYQPPKVFGEAKRKNNFEEDTELYMYGSYSPLIIDSLERNALKTPVYRYKLLTSPSYGDPVTMTVSREGTNQFKSNKPFQKLGNTQSWQVEFSITDQLNNTDKTTVYVPVGTPLLFLDTKMKTVGIGRLPKYSDYTLEVGGRTLINGTLHTSAVNFPRTATGDDPNGQWDTFYMLDSKQYFNNQPVLEHILATPNLRLGGNFYARNTGGVYLDYYGNIIGQPTANSGNSFSIIDADNKVRFTAGIGKGNTLSTEVSSYGGFLNLKHDNFTVASFRQNNNGGNCFMHLGRGIVAYEGGGDGGRGSVAFANSAFDALLMIRAKGVDTGSSLKFKKNVKPFLDDVLSIIKSTSAYSYHYKDERDDSKRSLGLVTEYSPSIIKGKDGDTISQYSMSTYMWRGIQQLIARIEKIETKLEEKEQENERK